MISSDDPRLKWLMIGGAVVCFIAVFALVSVFKGSFAGSSSGKGSYKFSAAEPQSEAPAKIDSAAWKVYVTGAVLRPGVYDVPAGSRIDDAVSRAGGMSANADPEAINLAEKIQDGAHITVPRKMKSSPENASAAARTGSGGGNTTGSATANTQKPAIASHAGTSAPDGVGKINVNTASSEELQRLPGIGPTLANSIIDYRNANGKFTEPEDLIKVSGIGVKRLDKIRNFIAF